MLHDQTLSTSQQHTRVASCVNICVCMLEPQLPAEGSTTPLNNSTGARLYLLVERGTWQSSSLDQARVETRSHSASLFIKLCVQASVLSALFGEKASLYSLQWGTCFPDCCCGQKKKKKRKARARWAVILWEAHIPQGSISGPAHQPDYERTVPCSTATMETPCKWAWECESHGHQKGKQVSFITATQPVHTVQIRSTNLCW